MKYAIFLNILLMSAITTACAVPPAASTQIAASAKLPSLTDYLQIEVKPSAADSSITAFDHVHRVLYDPKIQNNNILLFLTGTTEKPGFGPKSFFQTALAQGYRVINLSYISYPAVSQICVGKLLAKDPDCAAHFRQKRIYGDNDFTAITDQAQDAITHRLTRLLQYLAKNDPKGHWQQYLKDGQPAWHKIAVSGQSQGGGMAQYLGKKESLARIISFSGGWDLSSRGHVANWYYTTAVTPTERWYATYNVKEGFADEMHQISLALGIPSKHIFALDKPLLKRTKPLPANKPDWAPAHGDGLSNLAYQALWGEMLGSGLPSNKN